MAGYTVIDVETTGLSPEYHDRVVEVGVVYVSDRGEIQDSWATLINPGRDVGPTRIHGLTAADVAGAPPFAHVAPYLLKAIDGRTMVAHNASFDLRFIAAEFVRAGVPLEELPLRGLCTMQWSSVFLETSSRRLIDCCRAGGIPLTSAHSAAADALATAQLLSHYLRLARFSPPWTDVMGHCQSYAWPSFPGDYPPLSAIARSEARERRQDAWLDQIVSRMPRAGDVNVDSYIAVLELALLDGFLAEHEKDELLAVALESGLSRGQVIDIHGSYLEAMAEVALEDEVVTPEERGQLKSVAAALGLTTHDVDHALRQAQERRAGGRHAAEATMGATGITLRRGDRVVFTGDMLRERSEWEAIARAAGLNPGGVTKATAVVVAADPNSMSGKAAKARNYGIPIVTEAAFMRLLDHVQG